MTEPQTNGDEARGRRHLYTGVLLAAVHKRRWLMVPGIVLPFLLMHAINGSGQHLNAPEMVGSNPFITKWPGPNGAFPPHQDPTLVDERHHTGVTIWAPLDDVGPENGMLHVVPGSHRFSTALRVQDVDHSTFGGLEQAVVGQAAPNGLEVGAVVVHADMFEHADGPGAVEGLVEVAVVLQAQVGAREVQPVERRIGRLL